MPRLAEHTIFDSNLYLKQVKDLICICDPMKSDANHSGLAIGVEHLPNHDPVVLGRLQCCSGSLKMLHKWEKDFLSFFVLEGNELVLKSRKSIPSAPYYKRCVLNDDCIVYQNDLDVFFFDLNKQVLFDVENVIFLNKSSFRVGNEHFCYFLRENNIVAGYFSDCFKLKTLDLFEDISMCVAVPVFGHEAYKDALVFGDKIYFVEEERDGAPFLNPNYIRTPQIPMLSVLNACIFNEGRIIFCSKKGFFMITNECLYFDTAMVDPKFMFMSDENEMHCITTTSVNIVKISPFDVPADTIFSLNPYMVSRGLTFGNPAETLRLDLLSDKFCGFKEAAGAGKLKIFDHLRTRFVQATESVVEMVDWEQGVIQSREVDRVPDMAVPVGSTFIACSDEHHYTAFEDFIRMDDQHEIIGFGNVGYIGTGEEVYIKVFDDKGKVTNSDFVCFEDVVVNLRPNIYCPTMALCYTNNGHPYLVVFKDDTLKQFNLPVPEVSCFDAVHGFFDEKHFVVGEMAFVYHNDGTVERLENDFVYDEEEEWDYCYVHRDNKMYRFHAEIKDFMVNYDIISFDTETLEFNVEEDCISLVDYFKRAKYYKFGGFLDVSDMLDPAAYGSTR
ncbi:hypothetical protein PCE1_001496 [Barthelona sp. PCE]